MVDSKHAMQHLNEVKPRFVVNEAVEQIAYADRIILNKVNFLPRSCWPMVVDLSIWYTYFLILQLPLKQNEFPSLAVYSILLADRFGV